MALRLRDGDIIDRASHHETVEHRWKRMDPEVGATRCLQLLSDKTTVLDFCRIVTTRTQEQRAPHRGGEGGNITTDLERRVETNATAHAGRLPRRARVRR